MRILRGKSNLEVSSQGFALFVVGLVLATFLGGAVRTILSSERVHARIVTELKSRFPKNEFQIGQTEVLLSRGMWPGLGLRLRQVSFRQDVCGKLSFLLEVPVATLPVDLFSLRHGHVRLGDVQIEGGRMHLDYRHCPSVARPTEATAAADEPTARGVRPPHLDWEEAAKVIGGLDLKGLVLTYERNSTWKLIVREASVHVGEDMRLRAQVDVQKTIPGGMLTHLVALEARGEERKLRWTMQSEFKEGQFRWTGDWNIDSNAATTKIQVTQMPLKDLSSELFQMGLTARDVKLKTAWLTCQATWEGGLARLMDEAVTLRNCKVEGAYGRVDLEQAEVFPRAERMFKSPAHLQVQKLQVQPVVESLGRQLLPAVMSKLGSWSGVVDYAGDLNWSLDGALENAEVIVSNQSVRGKQGIRHARLQASRVPAALEARLSEIQLQDGELTGGITAHLGPDANEGRVAVAIERLSFAPAIQNVLVGGQIAPLKIDGEGAIKDGTLASFNGTLASAALIGDGWRAEQLEIRGKFAGASFRGEGKVAHVEADTRWRFYPQLKNVREALEPAIAWRDIAAKLEINAQGGIVQALSGVEVPGKTAWRARGGWIRDGELSGTLMVGGAHPQAFGVRGEKGGLTILGRGESRE